jgi:hypothetical protein
MPPRKTAPPAERQSSLLRSAADYRGQILARDLLAAYLKRGRVSGTFLFLGQRGLGKTTLATVFARALVCEANRDAGNGLSFCGECYACRSIQSGNQPEFVIIRPRGQDITVAQMEEDYNNLSDALLLPVTLSHRVFIIDDAHCLNEKSGSQMLKLLEEPPARSVFILVSDKPGLILPTIHSRSQKITLLPLPADELSALLARDLPRLSAADHSEAARMSAGRYVDALALAQSPRWRTAVKALARELGASGDCAQAAAPLAEFEFDALWRKELSDSGLSEDDAAKEIAAPRKNELKRQALITAYERAAWELTEGRGGRRGLLAALALLRERINSNVDPTLTQAAFEVGISV